MRRLQETSNIPLYLQIKEDLLVQINNRKFSNQQLPGEVSLTNEYNVSRITVRRALMELQREGYIYRKQGRGTFVLPKSKRIEQNITGFYSLSDELEKRNIHLHSEVLELSRIIPNPEIAAKLMLKTNEEVYFLKRLRFAEDTAILIEYSYLPAKFFPGLDTKDFTKHKLYKIMREDYGIYPVQADLTFGATQFSEEELSYLHIGNKCAALTEDRLTYSSNKDIIEYSQAFIRPDKYGYHIRVGSV